MAVNVKMGVDISGFKKGVQDGQTILKGLNAELKSSEAEFKATGNAEKFMADKTQTLTSKLNIQKSIVDKTQAALKQMTEAGVDPADKAYQQLYAQLMNAQAGMYETQAALNGLGTSAQQAATGADQLTKSVNSIGKKVSLDQVISGIGKITSGLENATKKAIHLGEELWNVMLASAQQADDDATMAAMYGIDLQTFLKMKKLVTNGLDTSVEAILSSQSKLKKGIGSDSKDVAAAFEQLGISMKSWQTVSGQSGPVLKARDSMELFWEAGQKILAMQDEFAQESMAQALFGRSWHELVPLFDPENGGFASLEEYKAALDGVNTESEQSVKNLAEFNDEAGKLSGNLNSIKQEALGALAPALTEAAKAINGLLEEVLKYLQSEAGQQALADMSAALTELFSGLSEISAEDVVQGFQTAFNAVLGCLDWIVHNKNGIVTALEAIGVAFAAMKIGEFALNIGKIVNGFSNLLGGTPGKEAAAGNQTAATGGDKFSILDKAVTGMGTKFVLDYAWDAFTAGVQAEANHEGIEGFTRRALSMNASYGMYSQEEADRKAGELLALYSGFDEYLAGRDSGGGGASRSFELPVEPVAEEDSAAKLSEEIGVVHVPISLVWDRTIGGAGGGKDWNTNLKYANGIDFVPNTRLAWLHRGERVMTAQQNRQYTYNNHNYFGSVNLNNGLQIEQLTESIDRHNRRQMAGFGS